MDYGCFVKIEEGVEGLIHNSELDWLNKNIAPSKILSVSQKIKFKIVSIDKTTKRISLSYKAILKNPWEKLKSNRSEQKVKITNITDKSIFAETIESKLPGCFITKKFHIKKT